MDFHGCVRPSSLGFWAFFRHSRLGISHFSPTLLFFRQSRTNTAQWPHMYRTDRAHLSHFWRTIAARLPKIATRAHFTPACPAVPSRRSPKREGGTGRGRNRPLPAILHNPATCQEIFAYSFALLDAVSARIDRLVLECYPRRRLSCHRVASRNNSVA